MGRFLGAVLASVAAAGCLSSPGQGGDGDGDGGPDTVLDAGDGGTTELCGTARSLRDDFDVDEVDQLTWQTEQAGIDASGVEIWATPETYGSLSSHAEFLVAGGELQAELGFDALDEASRFQMSLIGGKGELVGLRHEDGLLELVVTDEDGERSAASRSFSALETWWRLREEGGEIHGEISDDGSAWEEIGSVGWSAPLARVEFALAGQSGDSAVDVLSVNQNAPEESSCPASTFTDPFDGAGLDRWWVNVENPCSYTMEGALELTLATDGACSFETRQRFDLRGSAMAVAVLDAGDCSPAVSVKIRGGASFATLYCNTSEEGPIIATYSHDGDGSVTSYDPQAHRFWRLRYDLGQSAIVWDVHPAEGGDWEQFDVVPTDADDVGATLLELSIEGVLSEDAVNGATFDDLNLAP